MTGSIKMFRLDFMSMKVYGKSYLIFLIYPVLFSFMGSIGMGFMGGMMFSILAGSIFSVQEKNHLERLYSMLALSERSQVGGRYLFLLANCLFVMLVMLPIQMAAALVTRQEASSLQDMILAAGIAWMLFWVLAGYQTPLYFRHGYTKMRMYGYIPMFVIALIPTLLITFLRDIAEPVLTGMFDMITGNSMAALLICLVIGSVIAVISYFASLRGYRKTKR